MNRDSKQVLTELLVYSAQNRNETSFRDLHDLWHADLKRFCVSRLGAADGADEITCEAWLSIARGLGRLDDPARFPRWSFRIVENRCVDWIRSRTLARRREAAAANEAERLAPAPAGPVDAPEEVLRLREAIATLPEAERHLLHLYYDADRSVAATSTAKSKPRSAAKRQPTTSVPSPTSSKR